MGQLRRKLEADPARPRHLITEPGMGYRFQPSTASAPELKAGGLRWLVRLRPWVRNVHAPSRLELALGGRTRPWRPELVEGQEQHASAARTRCTDLRAPFASARMRPTGRSRLRGPFRRVLRNMHGESVGNPEVGLNHRALSTCRKGRTAVLDEAMTRCADLLVVCQHVPGNGPQEAESKRSLPAHAHPNQLSVMTRCGLLVSARPA